MERTNLTARSRYSLKTRLYSIIAFLALLPLCAVVVTVISQQRMAQDDAQLEHATEGAMHLERINSLVYAVTMESRGIYMSADWGAAEKFANNLLANLVELQQEVRAWQADAVALQEGNVQELTQRVEDFIRFRTELVRLAREENTAAARTFGDNDANRNVRSALNRSLEMVALAYRQELTRARANVEAGDREFAGALALLAVIAGLVLCGGFVVVRKSLLEPLLWLRDWMLRLAGGDFDGVVNGHSRAAEIAEMVAAVETFRRDLVDRQRLSHETALLSSLNEWLQSCNSLGELYEMVGLFLARLLPGCSGMLFIYSNSRDVLDAAKAWNGASLPPPMHPEDCWGLRRGRTYTFGASEIDFPCGHAAATATGSYCCIPILAHGETIGLLHLIFPTPDAAAAEARNEALRQLGMVCAERISLAIANVKLRDQLRDQSIRDPLTGLFNRRYLLETGRREFVRAARGGLSVSVLSIDIDHFKKFNDNHGHDAGDAVLRAVGSCLETMFRAEDVPCRFGGEEFVVLLPGSDLAAASRRAEQLRKAIESLVVRYLDQNLPPVTISIGIAVFPEAGDTPQAVMRVADEALYRAKANGRNRVELAASARGNLDAAATGTPPAAAAPEALLTLAAG